MTTMKLARDLVEGDLVDLEFYTQGTDNEIIAMSEFAKIISVNNGWCDAFAEEDEVVLYASNLAEPVIMKGNTPLPVDVNMFE